MIAGHSVELRNSDGTIVQDGDRFIPGLANPEFIQIHNTHYRWNKKGKHYRRIAVKDLGKLSSTGKE
jgi:hypothetical protein